MLKNATVTNTTPRYLGFAPDVPAIAACRRPDERLVVVFDGDTDGDGEQPLTYVVALTGSEASPGVALVARFRSIEADAAKALATALPAFFMTV